jgi:hypothetical protein
MTQKIDRVYLIGLGGIGTLLAEQLDKLLTYNINVTSDITLIDGDEFDTHSNIVKAEVSLETSGNTTVKGNITRQLFDPIYSGHNKAEATCLRLSHMPNLKYVPDYINKDSFMALLLQDNGDRYINVVISAVDNEATRKEIILGLEELGPRFNFIYINVGNSLDTAHCSIWAKINGIYKFTNPLSRYANLANPSDTVPGRCSVLEASTPQLISANASAALLVLNTFQNILDNQPIHEEVNTYVRKSLTKPLGLPQRILNNN